MLKKNVYILYPAGYSGSYINWAINVSDKDLSGSTVKNPINTSSSFKLGGAGTSHNHVRVPTHQDIFKHFVWMVLNRPVDKKVYVINSDTSLVGRSIAYLMQSDPDGVFVVVHNDNDRDVDAYGTINCITKWQTYGKLRAEMTGPDPQADNIDFFESSREYRNFIVKNSTTFFAHMQKLDHDRLALAVQRSNSWYQLRNKYQPHEVNESGYVTDFSIDNRIFELSCLDVASDQFPGWLEKFMQDSGVSDAYDCSYVSDFHNNYTKAQNNLKWFDSIQRWGTTGELNDYLTSHCGIEAHLILRMFENIDEESLNLNWEGMDIEEINHAYQNHRRFKQRFRFKALNRDFVLKTNN